MFGTGFERKWQPLTFPLFFNKLFSDSVSVTETLTFDVDWKVENFLELRPGKQKKTTVSHLTTNSTWKYHIFNTDYKYW
jgi:hypothetical protein